MPFRHVAAVRERLRVGPAGTDGAPRLPEEDVERLPGAPAVEDIARAQRELVGEGARQLFVDALEHDLVDRAFVDVERELAG